jgi:uncharacterized membrane protein (DUF106 family)
MLNLLNVILIGILSSILAINIYSVLKLQYSQAFIRDELEKKVQAVIHNMDLTDLKEFNDLEPNMKELYKEYIAGAIIPMIVQRINILLLTSNEYNNFKNNKESYKKKIDEFLVTFKKQLEALSIEFITNSQLKA